MLWAREARSDFWANLQGVEKLLASSFNSNFFIFSEHGLRALSVYELLQFYSTTSFNLTLSDAQKSGTAALNSDFAQWNKNLNIFSQAFTKVFKSSIEEERTGVLFSNLSRSFEETTFISSRIPGLLGNLQKNSNSFYNSVLYQPNYDSAAYNLNSIYSFFKYFTIQFPFVLSSESDVIRYS